MASNLDFKHFHHDVFRKKNGNTLIICQEEVPKRIREKAQNPIRQEKMLADVILEVNSYKEVVWKWHQYKYLDINLGNNINASREWRGG